MPNPTPRYYSFLLMYRDHGPKLFDSGRGYDLATIMALAGFRDRTESLLELAMWETAHPDVDTQQIRDLQARWLGDPQR